MMGLTVTPEGRGIVLSDHDGAINVYDSEDGHINRRFKVKSAGTISRFCLAFDGATLLSVVSALRETSHSGTGGELFSWEFATGKVRPSQSGLPNSRFGGAFTPDGQTLIGDHGELFDVTKGRVGRTLQSMEHIGRCFAVSPDSVFAAAPISTTEVVNGWHMHRPLGVRVWELASARPLPRVAAGNAILLLFSPDGRTLATAEPNIIRLWNVATGQELYRLAAPEPQRSDVTASFAGSMAFAPDGCTLATGHPGGTILIWNVAHILKRKAVAPRTVEERRDLWDDVTADDPGRAAMAIDRLAAAPKDAVALLRDRLSVGVAAPADIQRWLSELNSDVYAVREAASKKLAEGSSAIEPSLKAALAANPSAEVKRRVTTLLDRPKPWPADLQPLRLVRLLERIANPAAREQLKVLAGGAAGATLTRAAAEALKRLDSR
jgi:hypothetical protein